VVGSWRRCGAAALRRGAGVFRAVGLRSRGGSIDDGALLCGYHHREFEKLGWSCLMLNGIPHYTPPHWLDPDQTPIRNTVHDIPAA
jgi:NADH:ubiquinone oxidoreductase subunit D